MSDKQKVNLHNLYRVMLLSESKVKDSMFFNVNQKVTFIWLTSLVHETSKGVFSLEITELTGI